MASNDIETRKKLRIALVGIRPADQVTLKGYLRVLLRLDVELEWVTAMDQGIGLFMINNEFRQATSVTKLLHANFGAPALYIARDELGTGSLQQNLLTIPLKQINLLNDWLMRNVSVLSGSLQPSITIQETPATSAIAAPTPIHSHANMGELIKMIQIIQNRQAALFELVEGTRVVAVLDTHRQLIWVKDSINKISAELKLRTYQGMPPVQEAKDSSHWFWQLALHNPTVLLPLIGSYKPHQLRYWAKPTTGDHRRDLLQIMTAIESQALSALEIAGRINVPVATVKQTLAALLFSGNLDVASYEGLDEVLFANSQPEVQSTPTPVPVPPPVVAPSPQKEEKLGFLARLRKKLGL